jgi:hypothetical protein
MAAVAIADAKKSRRFMFSPFGEFYWLKQLISRVLDTP